MFTPIQDIATTSAVPEANIQSKGTVSAEQSQLGLLELADGSFVLRTLIEFPLDEKRVGARLGKKKKDKETGEETQPVTSRIYSKSSNQAVYAADPEGNVMQIAARLFAPVAGAEEDATDNDVEV